MIVQVETVSFNTEVEEYIETYPIREAFSHYDANDRSYKDDVKLVKTDRLDALIEEIDANCIVQNPEGDIRRYDDADWVVRVYDGYNE